MPFGLNSWLLATETPLSHSFLKIRDEGKLVVPAEGHLLALALLSDKGSNWHLRELWELWDLWDLRNIWDVRYNLRS